ncbi:MAG: permease-like cell division protein FtsX [Syntrophobacteraceae bacterium]|nr:permease-like cell division protein FtsX [Syntrophobacteraceae bacterium]
MLNGRLLFLARSVVRSAGYNWFASGTALGGSILCLFLLGLLGSGALVLQHSLPYWWTAEKAILYLSPESTEEEQKRLVLFLKGLPEITEVRMVSSREARTRLENQLGSWKAVLEGLEDTFLPASLEISFKPKVRHSGQIEALLDRVRRQPAVEEVFYGKSWVEGIKSQTSGFKLAGAGIMVLALLGALLLILHSVKASAEARREELEAYEILGAAFLFGRVPFYAQGVFLGLAAGTGAALLVGLLWMWLGKMTPFPLSCLIIWDLWEGIFLMLGLMLTGVALGAAGGWLGVRFCDPRGRVSL